MRKVLQNFFPHVEHTVPLLQVSPCRFLLSPPQSCRSTRPETKLRGLRTYRRERHVSFWGGARLDVYALTCGKGLCKFGATEMPT